MALHQMEWGTSQLYIVLQARMLSRSYALSSADGLQVNTSLWNLMLPFTETGKITSPWTRTHLEFCSICPLSYFFSSLSFPTSLTLALFLIYLPYLLYCTPSGCPASPRAAGPSSISYPPPFHKMSNMVRTTCLYTPKPTGTCGNQARIVLLMWTDVSATRTHWHHHHDPSLPSSKARVNIIKISPFHAWYQFGYLGPQFRLFGQRNVQQYNKTEHLTSTKIKVFQGIIANTTATKQSSNS